MALTTIFRHKTRQESREEGQAVGREQANTACREWNRRREEALALRKPFDEPTPRYHGRNGSHTLLTAAPRRNASGTGDPIRKKASAATRRAAPREP